MTSASLRNRLLRHRHIGPLARRECPRGHRSQRGMLPEHSHASSTTMQAAPDVATSATRRLRSASAQHVRLDAPRGGVGVAAGTAKRPGGTTPATVARLSNASRCATGQIVGPWVVRGNRTSPSCVSRIYHDVPRGGVAARPHAQRMLRAWRAQTLQAPVLQSVAAGALGCHTRLRRTIVRQCHRQSPRVQQQRALDGTARLRAGGCRLC